MVCLGMLGGLAGCDGRYKGQPTPDKKIELRIQEVRPNNGDYQLSIQILNDGRRTRIRNITLLAYTEEGREVCSEPIGDISFTETVSVTVRCSGFPAIITANASTPICDDIRIRIIHWIGDESQKQRHIPDEIDNDEAIYNGTGYRRCDESLPPRRFVNTSAD